MQAIVDDILVEYQKVGKGKKILFVHGWGDSSKTFRSLQDKLKDKYQSLALDLPGFGSSQIPKQAWDLNEYADFLQKFLVKVNFNPDFVVAHSNGAAVVIIGLQSGLKVKKAILIGAAGIRDREKAKKILTKVMAKSGKVVTFWLPKEKKQKLQEKFYGTIGSDYITVPHMKETYRKTVAQDVQSEAAKIEIPVLLIYGAKDKATPVGYGKIYNTIIKNSMLKVVDGAEHFVHHDAESQVVEEIEVFLR